MENVKNKITGLSFIDILRSPCCLQEMDISNNEFICQGCGNNFITKEGIPVLLKRDLLNEENKTQSHYSEFPYGFLPTTKGYAKLVNECWYGEFFSGLDFTKKMIDCGGGEGVLSNYLLNYLNFPKENLLLYDISYTNCKMAKRLFDNVMQASHFNIPVEAKAFDYLIAAGTIQHTPSVELCLREFNRILKSGGMAYISVYSKIHWYYPAYYAISPILKWLKKSKFSFLVRAVYTAQKPFFIYRSKNFYGEYPRDERIYWNAFADLWLTPVAHFFTLSEIAGIIKKCGFDIILQRYAHNNIVIACIIRKKEDVV